MTYRGLGLPGEIVRRLGAGHQEPCDGYNNDCTSLAAVVVRGETDSYGSEMIYWCLSCHAKSKEPRPEALAHCDVSRTCGWVGPVAESIVSRDPDEGMSGPVYTWCPRCWASHQADQAEETRWYRLHRMGVYEDDDDDFDDDPEWDPRWDEEDDFDDPDWDHDEGDDVDPQWDPRT